MCTFIRQAPYRKEVDRKDGYRWHVLVFQVGDLDGSSDLRAAYLSGETRNEWDASIGEHVLVDRRGKRWKPKSAFRGADY